MIHEYALDPGLLNNWERWRYLTEKFGISQGRLISRYPKRWKKMVHEALEACPPVERLRIVEKMKSIDDRMIHRFHEWVDDGGWLTNAESEHANRPFHAIIAQANPRADVGVLVAADLDEQTPLWKVESEVKVKPAAEPRSETLRPGYRATFPT